MFEYQGVKKWRGQKLEQEKIKTFFPLKWQVTVVFERAKMKLILPRGLFRLDEQGHLQELQTIFHQLHVFASPRNVQKPWLHDKTKLMNIIV